MFSYTDRRITPVPAALAGAYLLRMNRKKPAPLRYRLPRGASLSNARAINSPDRQDAEIEEIRALYRMSPDEAVEIMRRCGLLTPKGRLKKKFLCKAGT